MTRPELVRLADVAHLLGVAGYTLETRKLAGFEAVLGETPYALVACVELNDWATLGEQVFDVQAALTHVAEREPSARAWDLYVVALIRTTTRDAVHRAVAESIEADTRYARKFVRIAVEQDQLDRALRPLLPLRPPADLRIAEPLAELRDELRELDIADPIADAAMAAFARTDTVEVP
jgi:hypothetical protein